MNSKQAQKAIAAGDLKAHSLWILLSEEKERDGYGLKPAVWEGAGEYQRVSAGDDLGFLVKVSA